MVGGGVYGKGAGIVRGSITRDGFTIKGSHHFMQEYRQLGGMTIGGIVGGGINGTTNEYLPNKSNGTGATGKKASIGRSKILGVSKV
jgi:hypothetical protein